MRKASFPVVRVQSQVGRGKKSSGIDFSYVTTLILVKTHDPNNAFTKMLSRDGAATLAVAKE